MRLTVAVKLMSNTWFRFESAPSVFSQESHLFLCDRNWRKFKTPAVFQTISHDLLPQITQQICFQFRSYSNRCLNNAFHNFTCSSLQVFVYKTSEEAMN